jgi:hypothetical protein
MDILNFISWIRGRRVVTSADPATSLLPVALKDDRRDDSYLTAGISVQNFATQVAAVIPPGAQGPIGPQGVPGPVGPAGLNWQGAWSALGTYVVDDAVGFGGASYFCTNNVGPGGANPPADPTSWALLASQGAVGPQGPQGIQGPQGPPGSGGTGSVPNGSSQYQTLYWTGTQWSPSSLLTNTNFGRIGINGVNTSSSHALTVFVNSALNGNGGLRMQNLSLGSSIYNLMQTPISTFQFGLNPPAPGFPIFDGSMFFTMNQARAIKFATGFTAGGGDRLIIQGNGQVVIGATVPTDPTSANLVVTTKSIELETPGEGILMRSANGLRWLVTVTDGGIINVASA